MVNHPGVIAALERVFNGTAQGVENFFQSPN